MPKPKIFAEGTVMYVPRPWLEALDLPQHIAHAAVMVIANVKADVPALLTDRHVPQGQADAVGVYTWRDGRGGPIIRVELDGGLTTLGHFRFDPHRGGRGRYIEPVAEEAPDART